jgi:tetratricopeptide (TPR) repeat protein
VVLAEIALFERRRSDALQYSIAAYNFNPGNSIAKNLAIELGGNKKVGKKTVLSQQLVIEGEQNLQESGCSSAQAFFKEAYKLDNKNGYAALKTAQCLWELSFVMDAIEWIEKAIQADPTLTEAYVTAASFYMARYDFDSALQVLLKARKVSPRSYEVYRGLAQLELKKENPQLSIEYAKVALKIYDADTQTLIVISKALYRLNQFQEAFQYIVRASENDSRNVEVHTMYGKILYKIQGIFASQEYLKNRIASYPLESAYRSTLAEIFLEDQKYREAEIMAREAIEYNNKSKEAFMILGKALKARDQKTAALNNFLDAFSIDPSDAEPLFEAGQLYIDIQKFDEAIKQFQRVLTMNRMYPSIYYNMAKVYFAQRKMKKVLEYCQIEIESVPNNDQCYVLSAEAYFYKADQEKRKLSTLNAKPINPNDVEQVENDKKVTYNKMISFYKLCADSYQRAIDIAPQNSNLFIDLSRCYRFAGEFDMSQKMVEKALEIERGNPVVWRENGLLFEQKGEYALALEAYKQYLILNPSTDDRDAIVRQMKELESKIKP